MKPETGTDSSIKLHATLVYGLITLMILLSVSCDIGNFSIDMGGGGSTANNQAMVETQTSLSVQMTQAAGKTLPTAVDVQSMVQTQSAAAVAATMAAQPAPTEAPVIPPTVEVQPAELPQSNETEEASAPLTDKAGFDEWMSSAKILLYEDMTGTSNVKRTILDAVEALNLHPDDAKSDAGIFLGKIASPPDAKGWDLIISGVEARRGAGGGDFIEPIRAAIKNYGSAAIMEQWNIDAYQGRAANLFSDCGVEFHQNFSSEGRMSAAGQVLYPLDAVDPILNEPNAGIRISNITDYWPDYYGIGTTDYEYGDKLKKSPNSKAIFVLGLKANEPESYGVLVNCIDRRLTLLTVSTHAYASERIRPLWENMIYQALKARYNTMK